MAVRAGAQPIEVDASHSIALSQPKIVADLIRRFARARRPAINVHGCSGIALPARG